MASRFFVTIATLLILAGTAGFFVSAGWVPWTYVAAFLGVTLAIWGFVARRKKRAAPASWVPRRNSGAAGPDPMA